MSGSDIHLSITPLKISDIPPEDAIIEAGREILESSLTWKQGKTYEKNTVKTLYRAKGPNDGASWYGRISEHSKEDGTFEEFWNKLGVNKTENEKEFLPDLKEVTLIKQISPTQAVWTRYYQFPPPISPRVFTIAWTAWLSETSPKTGIIVSLPIDVTDSEEYAKLEENAVKGRYVAVERIQELENGKLEWRVLTSSTPGGSIPQFVVDSSMASTISQDVTHFVTWLRKLRSSETTA
ncbi:hypothetical protein C8Q74DRAFT_86245 [Fomes fomentarius]|nr:hypothetical protein C8Q74DRAFT_86245 [Fomes fomentarius]